MAIANAVKFKKGQVANPNGRPPGLFADALRRALVQEDPRKKTIALHRIAAAMVREAEGGNVQAFKEIAERIDGKIPQPQEVSGPGGSDISITIEHVSAT